MWLEKSRRIGEHRYMKRHIWILIIALLIGSIVNIVVAWLVAIYHPVMHKLILPDDKEIRSGQGIVSFSYSVGEYRTAKIYQYNWIGKGLKHVTREDATSAGLPKWAVLNPEFSGVEVYPLAYRYEATGWPMISFVCATFQPIATGPQVHVVGGIELDFLPRRMTIVLSMTAGRILPTILPTKPIPSGLVVNTLVYSLAAWILLAGPFFVRRVLRARRRQCARCGYPIGASAVCTECGSRVMDEPITIKLHPFHNYSRFCYTT